jgi:hypothetical protein
MSVPLTRINRVFALMALVSLGVVHSVSAATTVVYIPDEFPGVCAHDLTNDRPMCPVGVTARSVGFCAAGLGRLTEEARRYGAAVCGGTAQTDILADIDLVLLVDDRNLSAALQQTIEPVVSASGGRAVVLPVRGLFRNRTGSVVRNMVIVGEGSLGPVSDQLLTGNQGGRAQSDEIVSCTSFLIAGLNELVCREPVSSGGSGISRYTGNGPCIEAPEGMTCNTNGITDVTIFEPAGQFLMMDELECTQSGTTVTCAPPEAATSTQAARTTRNGGGNQSTRPQQDIESDSALRVVGLDRSWFVLNRDAGFDEVANLVWGDAYQPSRSELYSREGSRQIDGIELEWVDTHWAVARMYEGFNSQAAARSVRPSFERALENAPELTGPEQTMVEARPAWIPEAVWAAVVNDWQNGTEGMRIFAGRSPARTDIVTVVRNGGIGAYVTQITDERVLYELTNIVPPSRLQEITGESSAQAAIRWLARANEEYNLKMFEEVKAGRTPGQAYQNYRNESQHRLVTAILEAYSDHVPGRAVDNPVLEQILAAWQSGDWIIEHYQRIRAGGI